MPRRFVPGFRPSTSGLHFANSFPREPVLLLPIPGIGRVPVGDASRGLCGGMVFTTRDFFEAGHAAPATSTPPPPDSALYRYLVKRLFDSFHLPRGPLRYYHWMNLPDDDRWSTRGVRWRTVVREWPKVKTEIDQGKLAPLGLVKLRSANPLVMGDNHQVLAYGYTGGEAGQDLAIHVYDPNYPDDDSLTLALRVAEPNCPGPIRYSAGGTVRGFFHTPYRPGRLPGATGFWSRKDHSA